jgi:hypothetical protein
MASPKLSTTTMLLKSWNEKGREKMREEGKKKKNEIGCRRYRKIVEREEEIVFCQSDEHIQDDKCSTVDVIKEKAERSFESASYHTVAQIDVEIARKKGETAVM